MDPRNLCSIYTVLTRRQRQICLRQPGIVLTVAEGVRKGIDECQYQFQYHRWNCTTFPNDFSIFGKDLVKGQSKLKWGKASCFDSFSGLLISTFNAWFNQNIWFLLWLGGTRELAFIEAVMSAAAAFNVARECSRGYPYCSCSVESWVRQSHITPTAFMHHITCSLQGLQCSHWCFPDFDMAHLIFRL